MAIPDWVNGTDLASVTAQQCKADLTTGLTYDLTNQILAVPMEQREQSEDVRPINRMQMNTVRTGVGDYLTLRALATRTAANSKMLAIYVNQGTYPYLVMTWVLGEIEYQMFGRIAGGRGFGLSQRAGQPIEIDLEPADPGFAVGQQAGVGTTGTVTGTTQSVVNGL